MSMAPPEPSAAASRRGAGDDDTKYMKLMCSHGGRFHPCDRPDGSLRYVGGETRVLVVPRALSFADLTARLSSEMMTGGGSVEVRAVMHRLADEAVQDVIVTVTCDEELDHMRDEYDRLRATRPAARFRVFVVTTATATAAAGPKRATTTTRTAGLPPLAPSTMRRVQSEQAIAREYQHRLTRRVHSAQELAGGVHHMKQQPYFHHHRHQHQQQLHQRCCCCACQRRDRYMPAPLPVVRPTYPLPYMSKKVAVAPPSVSAAEMAGRAAEVSTAAAAAAAREKTTAGRDVEAAVENRRAIWELE